MFRSAIGASNATSIQAVHHSATNEPTRAIRTGCTAPRSMSGTIAPAAGDCDGLTVFAPGVALVPR
jgi:hypothetical protein